jgi:hypothetical protein
MIAVIEALRQNRPLRLPAVHIVRTYALGRTYATADILGDTCMLSRLHHNGGIRDVIGLMSQGIMLACTVHMIVARGREQIR